MHGERQGTLSAGVVVFRLDGDQPRCLLLRAYRDWDFPKGAVEAGETPFVAARREVAEETGLLDLRFPRGEIFVETRPYGRGKVARYYLAVTEQTDVTLLINPVLGRPEHHAFRWVDCEGAAKLVAPRLANVVNWACRNIQEMVHAKAHA